MKISSSSISMSAQSSHVESLTKEESLKMWVGYERPDFEGKDLLDLSDEGKALSSGKSTEVQAAESDEDSVFNLSDLDKRKIQMLQEFIQRLTGKKIRFVVPEKIDIKAVDGKLFLKDGTQVIQPRQKQGWGLEYEKHESYYEKETMSFSSQGIVKTADGKEIRLSVQMSMSREFASQQHISIKAGDAIKIDPLVINFNGNAPSLTEKKYTFDLDSDGSRDQISFVSQGSGFLALDLNSDGIVNNGKELFGPNTGNGFAELAQYDIDHNNWIDENDSIYEKLRIWTKDELGNDKLFALGQKGLGAIYLGNVSTAFTMKSSANETLGQVSKTGIFLRENGSAGTIQHIDLAI